MELLDGSWTPELLEELACDELVCEEPDCDEFDDVAEDLADSEDLPDSEDFAGTSDGPSSGSETLVPLEDEATELDDFFLPELDDAFADTESSVLPEESLNNREPNETLPEELETSSSLELDSSTALPTFIGLDSFEPSPEQPSRQIDRAHSAISIYKQFFILLRLLAYRTRTNWFTPSMRKI